MCAGAAVYSALDSLSVRWSDRVGIMGIGGLGHLAIQFASKMGCQVVAYSQTEKKRADAENMGATEFHCLTQPAGSRPPTVPSPVDHLLLTSAKQPDWAEVIPLVRRGGTIVTMTVDPEELRVPYMELVMNCISIRGSLPALSRLHREMLCFVASHGISPMVEIFPFSEDGINQAMENLRKGAVRYRAVVEQA